MWFKYIWLVVLLVMLALNSAEWYSTGTAKYAFFTGAYLVLLVWWISEIKVN